jgi:DNA invertase Pin-like site-specific DNA recombinase
MKTYYAYIRVSTARQGVKGVSLQEQRASIMEYAERRGMRIAEWFEDRTTAAKRGRPVFSKLVSTLKAKKTVGVIIHKIDRGAQSPRLGRHRRAHGPRNRSSLRPREHRPPFAKRAASIIWAMKQHGATLVTPFQVYGQSEDNVVWMYLEFGMAQKYVDDLSRNVKRGLRTKAEMGWLPSQSPLGYVNRVARMDTRSSSKIQSASIAFLVK